MAPGALAAEYTFSPRVDLRLSGDDNLQTTVEERAIEAYNARLSPSLSMAYRADRLKIISNTRLDFTRFASVDFDTDDQFMSLSVSYGGETSLFQMDMNARRQSQRTSEVLESGFLGGTERVAAYTVRPSYVFALNDLYRVTAGASWSGQQYELTRFDDYKNYGLDLALSRQLTDRQSIDLTIFASEFETEQRQISRGLCDLISGTVAFICQSALNNTQTSTLGAQVGYRRVLSETSEFGISVGGRQVEARDVDENTFGCAVILSDFFLNPSGALAAADAIGNCIFIDADFGSSTDSSGLITRAFFENTGERTKWSATYERSISPVGLGFLIETDRVEGGYDYRFSPKTSLTVRMIAQQTAAVASESLYERDFYSINTTLTWRMSEHWTLSPGIRWRRQDASFLTGTAQSISGYVEISYRPRGTKVSR